MPAAARQHRGRAAPASGGRRGPILGAAVALALAWASAGCASPPPAPPFAPPAIGVVLGHHAGTPITGPLPEAAIAALDPEPAHALALQGRVFVLEHYPHEAAVSLAAQTRLQVTHPGAEPLLPAARLGAGVGRVPAAEAEAFLSRLDAGELGRFVPAGEASGALPGGVTAALRLASHDAAFPFTLAVMVSRPSDAEAPLDVALVFKGQEAEAGTDRSTSLIGGTAGAPVAAGAPMAARAPGAAPTAAGAPARLAYQTEGLLLGEDWTPGGAPLVLVVPLRTPQAPDAALVLDLRASVAPVASAAAGGAAPDAIATAPDAAPRAAPGAVPDAVPPVATADAAAVAAHAAATAQALRNVADALAEQRRLAAALTDQETFLREMLAALGSLDVAERHRAALVFVAGATGAQLAQDLALVVDEATLAAFVAQVVSGEPAVVGTSGSADAADSPAAANDAGAADEPAAAPTTRAEDAHEQGVALGWLLERAAYRLFIAASNEGQLPPGLAGVLLRHTGEVGRYAGSLEEIVAACDSLPALHARLLHENRLYLEDGNPAARVRAFDWLAGQGVAPPGYDPLAPLAERRAALARSEAAEDAVGESQPEAPAEVPAPAPAAPPTAPPATPPAAPPAPRAESPS